MDGRQEQGHRTTIAALALAGLLVVTCLAIGFAVGRWGSLDEPSPRYEFLTSTGVLLYRTDTQTGEASASRGGQPWTQIGDSKPTPIVPPTVGDRIADAFEITMPLNYSGAWETIADLRNSEAWRENRNPFPNSSSGYWIFAYFQGEEQLEKLMKDPVGFAPQARAALLLDQWEKLPLSSRR